VTSRRSIVLVGASLLWGCGGKAQPRSTFALDVLASQGALDSFVVSADGLEAQPNLHFMGSVLIETLTSTAPLATLEGQPLIVRAASNDGAPVSQLVVTPFVCASDPTFADKVRTGWQGTETLQISLQADGTLNPENEFDRQLAHRCDWVAPGGGGEGSATPNRSPTLCTEADRAGTVLQVVDVSDAAVARALATTTCAAYHYNYSAPPDVSGVIMDQFAIAKPDEQFPPTLTLSHCWRTGESFPSTVTADQVGAGTCAKEGLAVELGAGTTLSQVVATAGSWTLANGPELPGGGHQIADVDLTFGTPGTGAPAFKVTGHIDLPIVKVRTGP